MNLAFADLSTLLSLPDPEAAEALSQRMCALDQIHRLHERSFYERGVIALEFERRQLWRHLVSPETGDPFPSLTAWISSGFLGCRRTTFNAKKVMAMLADTPTERLAGVPTGTLWELTRLSTAERNDPRILDAARTLGKNAFLEAVAKGQHVEPTKTLIYAPPLSGARIIEGWIEFALENDLAGSPAEALVMACAMALREAKAEVPA